MNGKNWVDFEAVKEAVSINMVFGHYGIELSKQNATSLRGQCPLPTRVGDNEMSFTATLPNKWACHASSCVANRDGKKGGNQLDFVAVMEGCSIRDAALKLQDWFKVAASNERPENYVASRDRTKEKSQLITEENDGEVADTGTVTPSNTNEAQKEVNKPLGFELQNVDHAHEYFRRRGIKAETASHFGVGYFGGKGLMSERIVIPIHNEVGGLIAYAGRSIDDSEPKYKLPAGFKKSLVLFNLHRVLAKGQGRAIILVEGFFDSMKIHQAGFLSVASLMGSALSEHQEQLLIDHFREVIVMMDGDEGGRAAAREIISRLARKMFVRQIDVPDDSQPDKLSSEEIQTLLSDIT